MSLADPLKPRSLKKEGNGLAIEWADGTKTFATWKWLRDHCPCATCVDLREKPADPFRLLTPEQLRAKEMVPVSMVPKGYYAYQIAWNDGHDTGIYSLDLLRSLNQLSESDNSGSSQ